jgi:hypothetical protein
MKMKMYVNNAKMATPKNESRSVGIQNRNVFKSLFPIRLVAKKNAKNNVARIQNRGEKIFSTTPPATAPKPVAFCSLIPPKH